MQVPEELARREKRLAEIARAKVVLEARAKERHARERAEYEAKMAAPDAKAAQTGKKPGGRVPQPPVEGPLPTDQVNLTDEESRIMPVAGGGFEQCYNAQAAVAAAPMMILRQINSDRLLGPERKDSRLLFFSDVAREGGKTPRPCASAAVGQGRRPRAPSFQPHWVFVRRLRACRHEPCLDSHG